MFRFTIRDVLWLMVVVLATVVIVGIGKMAASDAAEGNACAVIAATVFIAGCTRIYRQAQARR
jgi:hypothetical protein